MSLDAANGRGGNLSRRSGVRLFPVLLFVAGPPRLAIPITRRSMFNSFGWRMQCNRSRTGTHEGQSEAEWHRVDERIDRQRLICRAWFFRMLPQKVDRYGEVTKSQWKQFK